MDVATAAKYIPTLVPRAVGAIGGGPGLRAVTGGATAAAEGGALGGVSAAMHDQNVEQGALIGAGGGILGQAVGGAVNAGTRKFNELFRGKHYEAPTYKVNQLSENPNSLEKVNVATRKADIEASTHKMDPLAKQKAYVDEYSKLQGSKGFNKDFTKAEKEQIDRIVQGDFGTNAAERMGSYATNPLFMGGMAGAGGVPGIIAAGTMGTMGQGLKSLSSGGTEEAVRDLRRAMYMKNPNSLIEQFKGPISPEWLKRLRHGATFGGLEGLQ